MARDKLITIRIEGEKREAFNQLAKSQNTDTASLLYDFISGCLSGTLDIGIVTGKGNRLDNQIDSERIGKLETTTQEIGERLGKLSQKLEDWIWVSQRSQENNLTELKDQISILAIQLDSQKDSQEMTTQKIDTDSQKDRQEIDMEQLLKLQREALIADHSPIPPGETSPLPPSPDEQGTDAIETVPKIETVEPDSSIELDKGAIETVTGKTSPMIEPEPALETVTGETSKTSKGLNPTEAHNYLISQGIKAAPARRTLNDWVKQGKISGTSPQGKNTLKHLALRDGLYYPKD